MLASPRWATKRRYRSRAAHTPYQKSWLATPPESGSPLRAAWALPPGGEELGWEDARKARFRTAAHMVEMWCGLDLPAWEARYVLRDARLGYLSGYERALISDKMAELLLALDHSYPGVHVFHLLVPGAVETVRFSTLGVLIAPASQTPRVALDLSHLPSGVRGRCFLRTSRVRGSRKSSPRFVRVV